MHVCMSERARERDVFLCACLQFPCLSGPDLWQCSLVSIHVFEVNLLSCSVQHTLHVTHSVRLSCASHIAMQLTVPDFQVVGNNFSFCFLCKYYGAFPLSNFVWAIWSIKVLFCLFIYLLLSILLVRIFFSCAFCLNGSVSEKIIELHSLCVCVLPGPRLSKLNPTQI